MPQLRPHLEGLLAPRYVVLRELPAGGMGRVFVGRDPVLDREVAIKLLPPERATAVAVERFIRESLVLARLNHPNIIPILEAQHAGALLWFVMPFMAGDTLAARIAQSRLDPSQLRQVGIDLLDALAHAHANGVVHRDIKPANVFMQGEHAVLADFGIAALSSDDDATLTMTGNVVGTPRYMSPEQRAGAAATVASDIYAVGATLFEAATGVAWDGTGGRKWESVPRTLRPQLRKALAGDPADRWQTAAQFRDAIAFAANRPMRALMIGAAAIAAAAMTWLAVGDRARPRAETSPRRSAVVVLPFGLSDDTLARAVSRLATDELEWFPPADAMPWLDAVVLSGRDASRVAQYHVSGSVSASADGSGRADISVRDSAGRAAHHFVVPGNVRDQAGWGRDIADSIVSRLHPTKVTEFRELAGMSRDMDARRALFDGQALFLQGDAAGAEKKYHEAWARDSNFHRARWAELLARQWQRLPFEEQLADLGAHADQLPDPLRSVIQLQLEPDLSQRIAGFDALAANYPGSPLIRQLRANELFSRGPLIGRPLREGVESMLAVAASLPGTDRVDVLTHVAWGAIRLGDRRLADSAMRARKLIAPPNDPYGEFLTLARAGRFRRWLGVPLRLFALATSDDDDLARVVRLGLQFDNPFDQLAIARSIGGGKVDRSIRVSMLGAQATALLLLGRPAAAIAIIDTAAAVDSLDVELQLQAAEWRLFLPLAGVDTPARELPVARAALEGLGASRSVRAHWALALDAAVHSDTVRREWHRAQLRNSTPDHALAGELDTYLQAFVHSVSSRHDSALRLTERIWIDVPDATVTARGPFVRALVHLWRANWQRTLGRNDAALRELVWHENNDVRGWPSGAPLEGEVDAALSGVARIMRAELLMERGKVAEACALVTRVRELWHDAERGFAAWRKRADKGSWPGCP